MDPQEQPQDEPGQEALNELEKELQDGILIQGGWAVLHGLSTKKYNGLFVRILKKDSSPTEPPPPSAPPSPFPPQRWICEIVSSSPHSSHTSPSSPFPPSSKKYLKVKQENLVMGMVTHASPPLLSFLNSRDGGGDGDDSVFGAPHPSSFRCPFPIPSSLGRLYEEVLRVRKEVDEEEEKGVEGGTGGGLSEKLEGECRGLLEQLKRMIEEAEAEGGKEEEEEEKAKAKQLRGVVAHSLLLCTILSFLLFDIEGLRAHLENYLQLVEEEESERGEEGEVGGGKGYSVLASVYAQVGEVDKELQATRKAHEKEPDCLDYMMNVGHIVSSMGDHSTALRWYQKAANHDPLCVSPHYHLGKTLLDMNRKQDALEQLKKVFDCTVSNHPYDLKTAVFNCPAYPYARMGVAMMEGGGMLLPQVLMCFLRGINGGLSRNVPPMPLPSEGSLALLNLGKVLSAHYLEQTKKNGQEASMGWLEGALAAISTAMFYDKNDRQSPPMYEHFLKLRDPKVTQQRIVALGVGGGGGVGGPGGVGVV